MQKTYSPTQAELEKNRNWFVVDAAGKTLGRLSSEVARILRGKHKPTFAPHADAGDFIIVVNAGKVVLTGLKEDQKVYVRVTGRPGGLTSRTARQVRARHPERLIEHAVRGMLPKNALGRRQLKKLKVYAGPDHPHEAQQPEPLELVHATL